MGWTGTLKCPNFADLFGPTPATVTLIRMKRALIFHLLLALVMGACGQTSSTRSAVRLMATVQPAVPSITLHWQDFANCTGFTIYRRAAGSTTWGNSMATLLGTALEYVDTTVQTGVGYEYKVVRSAGGSGYGYVRSGIAVPPVDMRGKLVLLVESAVAAALPIELEQLRNDLNGDGWSVIQHSIDVNATPTNVHTLVAADFNASPMQVKAVYILGHVPVPYSGNMAPDGHGYHQGAWACDGYYGDMNGTWTDASVNNAGSNFQWNHNIPGDGKFDQNDLPTALELQVGRVDLSRLDVFAESEMQLLAAYLGKAHAWKTAQFSVPRTAVVWDNLTWVGNPLASSGYMSAAPCVGIDSLLDLDPAQAQFSQHYLATSDLLTFQASTGLQGSGVNGTTFTGTENGLSSQQLVGCTTGGVFNMAIGSYFGDWDNPDNLLRAELAKGNCLAHMWSGMPNWFLHPMAMGEPIGYCALRTMNNTNQDYSLLNGGWQGQSMGQAHMGLMGDPSIRMQYIAPPTELVATNDEWYASFVWSPSPEAVEGYHIYRIDDASGSITRITEEPVMSTSFTSSSQFIPGARYMVRALKLMTTPSGSYYDLSLGALAVAQGTQVEDCLGTVGGTSIPGTPCDDGNPLTTDEVFNTNCVCYSPTVGLADRSLTAISAWPSPANDALYVRTSAAEGVLVARTLAGAEVMRAKIIGGHARLDTRRLAAGTYVLELDTTGVWTVLRFVVQH